MVLVEAAAQKDDGEERGKQHLGAAHHLVHAGGDAEQADVHEHGRDEVEEGGDGEQERLAQRALGDAAVVGGRALLFFCLFVLCFVWDSERKQECKTATTTKQQQPTISHSTTQHSTHALPSAP